MTPSAKRVIALVLIVAALGGGVWANDWYNEKPPPVEAGQVRLYGRPGGGKPPDKYLVTDELIGVATVIGRNGDPPFARANFFRRSGSGTTTRVQIREGDEFSVGDVRLRVVHIWDPPRLKNRAIDLQVLSGPSK